MDGETIKAMASWVGHEFRSCLHQPFDQNEERAILWSVAERLEREGWRFLGWGDLGYLVHAPGPRMFDPPVGAFWPSKSAAVVAAWRAETGAKP